MEKDKTQEILGRIDKAIDIVKKKESVLYFFVADSKNVPNAKMEYIYQLAYTLHEKKYNVCMLYQLNDEYSKKEIEELTKNEQPINERRTFVGVSEWLGEKYGKLKHLNISNGAWQVSPYDFLFIPEVFSELMRETYTKHAPCKRYVIVENFRHITEFIPFGDQWASYGITDAIVPSQKHSDLVKSVFRYANTYILPPYIPEYFRKPLKAKKLIVNVVTKTKEDAEHIVKMFYWKYPLFNFIAFRFLVNFPREKYAEMLQEGAITLWVDYDSSFGFNALESMRCGNIVIGKIPQTIPEWMTNENGELKLNGLWVDDVNQMPDVLASVINEWVEDEVPQLLYDEMDKTNQRYTVDEWSSNVDKMMKNIFEKRIKEFETLKNNKLTNVTE